jgi:hypothetical protein
MQKKKKTTTSDFEQRAWHNEAGYINYDNTTVDVTHHIYFPPLKISSFPNRL